RAPWLTAPHPTSLHDALPISCLRPLSAPGTGAPLAPDPPPGGRRAVAGTRGARPGRPGAGLRQGTARPAPVPRLAQPLPASAHHAPAPLRAAARRSAAASRPAGPAHAPAAPPAVPGWLAVTAAARGKRS